MSGGAQTREISQEELEEVVGVLVESKDALIQLARIATKLHRSGVLSVLETLVDEAEGEFNAIAKPELMGMVANLMMLGYILGSINQGVILSLMDKLPRCLEEAHKEFNKDHEKLGLLEMLNLVRSPEFAALLKAMQKALSCLKGR